MRMKMPFHEWFYRTHVYLQNYGKNGLVDYNDTKQVPMSDRFNKLVELESELFAEQPFGVIANRRGFNKLIDLLEKSNYTFEDINDSLVDAYKHSLTNAMSSMLVNTHAVMFKCMNTDRRYVATDRFSGYYIVDVPFNQLHFGDRDEFIRQQLWRMHTEENDRYIPLTEFVTSPYTDLLGFTLMCCVNGKICNDCLVALDDKGFKFKINWPYDYKQCYFVIYKFDSSKVYVTKTTYEDLLNSLSIPVSIPDAFGQSCIVNLYDENFSKTNPSVPNFGTLSSNSLRLINLQQKTLNDFERLRTNDVTVVIYALKYFHEVPNLYPAVNYYDIIDSRRVYDETESNVVDGNDNPIYASETTDINKLEICTPPIVLDRSGVGSFTTIVKCLNLRDNIVSNYDNIKRIGNLLSSGNVTSTELISLKNMMSSIETKMNNCYKTYVEGALLTSLVDSDRLNSFEKLMLNISNFINLATIQNLPQYTDFNVFPELYGVEFITFADYVTKPFTDNTLSPFTDIIKTTSNYFTTDNSSRFNRPVSEQCFITLKYDRDENCWVFDVPNIKHFKGVGNSFYIDEDLKGDEIFKFFVLYTDTENSAELTTEPMSLDQVFDFDLFYDEVARHIGYIKYWYAENKIMKLCKTVYGEYTSEKSIHILSKILKHKLDGDDILNQYPTMINYEPSNVSSLNWNDYDELSDEAPFAVNFLFYTLSLMNGNEDKLQAYFYRQLMRRMNGNRYADIVVSSIIDRSFMIPTNYSIISISPNDVDTSSSNIPSDSGVYSFYGTPFLTDNTGNVIGNPYRYTFNMFEDDKKYPLITENDYDETSYLEYSSVSDFNGKRISYRHDINITRLLTRYLISCYDAISYLQTYYKTPWNATEDNYTFMENIANAAYDISTYAHEHVQDFINSDTMSVAIDVVSNSFDTRLHTISGIMSSIRTTKFNGRNKSIEDVSNEFLKTLKSVFINTGFDDGVSKRVRNLYIHFKKINELQSIYDFLKWVDEIDIEMIDNLDGMRSENENGVFVGSDVFKPYADSFHYYIDSQAEGGKHIISTIRGLKNTIDGLFTSNYTSHFKPIIDFCEDIIENWIFDFYILDDIEFDNSVSYNDKPYVVTVDISSGDRFHPNKGDIIDENSTLIFEPIVENVNGSWKINHISKICEYAFFLGSNLSVTMNVKSQDGTTIGTLQGVMKFFRIGSSADDMISFNQYPNMKNSCIDIQNVHEEFEINSDDMIVNKKFGKMNYELLVGNNYCQLDHVSELILERKTMLQGSVDRVYLPGYLINRLSNHEFGQHNSFEVYFKPNQVLHLPIVNNEMTSVGGKYFVGQTLYLITDDQKCIFPVIVTAVDMSKSSGFVEAIIDQIHSKWFKINDVNEIKRYMENTITCTVIDDNISNFLDEYTNSNNVVYQIPEYPRHLDPTDDDNMNTYSMPGDPLYVTSNAQYVYTRLNWIFNKDIPNRYMDTTPQNHDMIYIDSTDSLDNEKPIHLRLINHSFEPFTDPENYPILREEPDDHNVWNEERKVFNSEYVKTIDDVTNLNHTIEQEWKNWNMNPHKTQEGYERFMLHIHDLESKRDRTVAKSERIRSYLEQLEPPTTWYNVRTYETSQIYITNGRAPRDFGRIVNTRNIPYTNKLDVLIYDWEHKYWISPDKYTVTVEELSSVKLEEFEDYNTTHVMNSITITPNNGFPSSKKLLIYLSYDKSDVFDSISINPKTCEVRFKPLLTLDSSITDYDPYEKINIRKHFDGHEKYIFDEYSEIPNFSKEGWLVKRPKTSGKYVGTPNLRFLDMKVFNNGIEYDLDNFEVYIHIPFKDTTSTDKYITPTYTPVVVQPIDGFVPDQTIKLICINNNEYSSYNGNISSVIFEAHVTENNGDQVLQITDSTLPNWVYGSFTCTVLKDNRYPHSGGIVIITIEQTENDVLDGEWLKLTNCWYTILPDEFVIVPKSSFVGKTTIDFRNEYKKSLNKNISVDDNNTDNPYLFYYNETEKLRYPIADVRKNSHKERLVIDKTLNPSVNTVKNTYISISRYVVQKIPKDGIIDMTGYLPTPLSREHYEFWVNGRYIKNPEDVKIISPTSIQLTNLKSLRNFECVELVDDYNDSALTSKGSVYIDLEGNVYSSHEIAMKNKNVFTEDIRYTFNTNNQQLLHTKTRSIISNPNNKNLEKDIFETIQFDTDTPTNYEELLNIPSINGVDVYNPMSYNLGLIETPNKKILEMFDKVWKLEQSTNPLFPKTHMLNLGLVDGEKVILHTKYSGKDDKYILYANGVCDEFFTLYISKSSNGSIDDVENTLKIIPFIRTGVFVYVDKSLQGQWLHCTHPNVNPIKIM